MFDLRKHCPLCMIALVFVFPAAAALGDEVRLEMKFREGEVLCYKVTEASSGEQMGMKTMNEQVKYWELKTTEVDGDTAVFEVKTTRVTVKSENPMTGKVDYDSSRAKENADPKTAFYGAIVGKKFLVKLNSRGEVIEVKGYSEIGKQIVDLMVKSMGSGPQAEMSRKMFEGQFTDEAKKLQMGSLFPCFPKDPVETGFEWKEESEMKMPPSLTLVTKLKNVLDSADGVDAKVKSAGTIEMKPIPADDDAASDDPMAAMMKMIKIKDGKFESTLDFDMERGVVRRKSSRVKMTMEMPGMEISSVNESVMELVKKGAEKEDMPSKEG